MVIRNRRSRRNSADFWLGSVSSTVPELPISGEQKTIPRRARAGLAKGRKCGGRVIQPSSCHVPCNKLRGARSVSEPLVARTSVVYMAVIDERTSSGSEEVTYAGLERRRRPEGARELRPGHTASGEAGCPGPSRQFPCKKELACAAVRGSTGNLGTKPRKAVALAACHQLVCSFRFVPGIAVAVLTASVRSCMNFDTWRASQASGRMQLEDKFTTTVSKPPLLTFPGVPGTLRAWHRVTRKVRNNSPRWWFSQAVDGWNMLRMKVDQKARDPARAQTTPHHVPRVSPISF